MRRPTVTFLVPCYKLAHLLPECLESILSQTYEDFEVLIMDDCSPDRTTDVVSSFSDPRVRYIRNDCNIGHLGNYNKGIELSRGDYVWLISADDRLRRRYALQRYVRLMHDHPQVGYVFCPGVGLQNGIETGIIKTGRVDNYYYGSIDKIFSGREFIATVLRNGGGIVSASVLVRKDCYRDVSMFPLDMPHQGDTYLWFMWALEYDVAYVSEPLVNYRFHDLNMSKNLFSNSSRVMFVDEMNVLWRTKQRAEQKGYDWLADLIESVMLGKYANFTQFANCDAKHAPWKMSTSECHAALRMNAVTESDYERLRYRFDALLKGRQYSNDAVGEMVRQKDLAMRLLWCVGNMRSAGDYADAHNLAAQILTVSDWSCVDSAIIGSLYILEARLCWNQRKLMKSISAISRAVARHPKILGRPLKMLLRRYKLASANLATQQES